MHNKAYLHKKNSDKSDNVSEDLKLFNASTYRKWKQMRILPDLSRLRSTHDSEV